MFLIPTYLAESPIHGIGVFTPRPIPEDTIIWRFDDRVDWKMTPDELDRFPEPYQAQLRRWSFIDEDGLHVFCGDNAKFMNHAPDANCDDPYGPDGMTTITNRDIAPDEELTSNYTTFDAESAEKGEALYRDA